MAASQEAMRAPRTVLAESAPLPFEDLARGIRLKAVQRREKRQGLSAAVSSSFLPSFLWSQFTSWRVNASMCLYFVVRLLSSCSGSHTLYFMIIWKWRNDRKGTKHWPRESKELEGEGIWEGAQGCWLGPWHCAKPQCITHGWTRVWESPVEHFALHLRVIGLKLCESFMLYCIKTVLENFFLYSSRSGMNKENPHFSALVLNACIWPNLKYMKRLSGSMFKDMRSGDLVQILAFSCTMNGESYLAYLCSCSSTVK